MRIRMHTCDVRCLGRVCFSLRDILHELGHQVDINVVWFGDDEPLIDDSTIDLNVIVAGWFIMARLSKQGLPRKSKNVMWLVDPLPEDKNSIHYIKSNAFLGFADGLDGLVAMNQSIERFVNNNVAGLPTWRMPYRLSERYIREPLADHLRTIDFMHLAHLSPRRESAEQMLKDEHIEFTAIDGGVWGQHRDEVLRGARVLFQVYPDEHFYFDQVRIIDAWSLGVVVLCEEVEDMKNYPMENGNHLVAGNLSDFPELARELIKDKERRMRIARNAQNLLRTHYLIDPLQDKVEEILDHVM